MLTGTVFELREFTVQDGPGVRQTVFLKGCPLRCRWCHNPEGLSATPQLMVSTNGCTGCGNCTAVCRHPEGCVQCGECVRVCPQGLRKICGETVTSQELIRRVLSQADYYAALGGGVTFSGGEPLMQGEFLLEVLKGLPGVHKAIETSGFCSRELFERVIAELDLVMMDLKLVNSEQHQYWTGKSNGPILRNLKVLQESEQPYIIRIPLIPGVTDTRENQEASARLLAEGRLPERVELLPYHLTAGAKYPMLSMEYRPEFSEKQPVRTWQKLFEAYGMRCEVL